MKAEMGKWVELACSLDPPWPDSVMCAPFMFHTIHITLTMLALLPNSLTIHTISHTIITLCPSHLTSVLTICREVQADLVGT